jgi:hypothetical protein
MPELSSKEIFLVKNDFFSIICTSPALFHSFVSFVGAYINARYSTQFIVSTPEIIAHKAEAIRQINLELSKDSVSDALLLAIMQMARLRDETDLKEQKVMKPTWTSPFKPPSISLQWQEKQVINFTLEDAHFKGIQAVVNLKGGVDGIKSPCVAKTLAQ